jgi:hypothetical protein
MESDQSRFVLPLEEFFPPVTSLRREIPKAFGRAESRSLDLVNDDGSTARRHAE